MVRKMHHYILKLKVPVDDALAPARFPPLALLHVLVVVEHAVAPVPASEASTEELVGFGSSSGSLSWP